MISDAVEMDSDVVPAALHHARELSDSMSQSEEDDDTAEIVLHPDPASGMLHDADVGGDSDLDSLDDDTGTIDYSDDDYSDEVDSSTALDMADEQTVSNSDEEYNELAAADPTFTDSTQLDRRSPKNVNIAPTKKKRAVEFAVPEIQPLTKKQKAKFNKLCARMVKKPSGLRLVDTVEGAAGSLRLGAKTCWTYKIRLENLYGPIVEQTTKTFRLGLGEVIQGSV